MDEGMLEQVGFTLRRSESRSSMNPPFRQVPKQKDDNQVDEYSMPGFRLSSSPHDAIEPDRITSTMPVSESSSGSRLLARSPEAISSAQEPLEVEGFTEGERLPVDLPSALVFPLDASVPSEQGSSPKPELP